MPSSLRASATAAMIITIRIQRSPQEAPRAEARSTIIGDRVRGLPRDVSVGKSVPFNELELG